MAVRRCFMESSICFSSSSVRLITCARVSTSMMRFLTCHFQSVHSLVLTSFQSGMSFHLLISVMPQMSPLLKNVYRLLLYRVNVGAGKRHLSMTHQPQTDSIY